MSNVWFIRAGDFGEHQGFNLDSGLVAIGWGEVGDLRCCDDKHSVQAKVRKCYDKRTGAQVGKIWPQLWNFYNEVAIGDWVVLPLKNGRSGAASGFSAVGRIKGKYRYSKGKGLCFECRHQRNAVWLRRDIPNEDVPLNKKEFGNRLTISRVKREEVADELAVLMTGGLR